jgi:SPP1 gp7 family putative phage head morphogenesis protein
VRVNRSIEGRLVKTYQGAVDLARRIVRERVLPSVRADSSEASRLDAIRTIDLDQLMLVYSTELDITRPVQRAAREATDDHKRQQTRVAEAVLGVRPELEEPWIADEIRRFTAENVRLIKNVGRRFFVRAEAIVKDGFERGLRVEEISKRLEQRFIKDEGAEVGIAKRRARLIARDQLGSLTGNLTQKRNEDLGVKAYFWRTSQDERVRKTHRQRNGKRFVYAQAIEPQLQKLGLQVDRIDGHAGRPIQCRCTQEPDIEAMLTEIERESPSEAPAPARRTRAPRARKALTKTPRVRRQAPSPAPSPVRVTPRVLAQVPAPTIAPSPAPVAPALVVTPPTELPLVPRKLVHKSIEADAKTLKAASKIFGRTITGEDLASIVNIEGGEVSITSYRDGTIAIETNRREADNTYSSSTREIRVDDDGKPYVYNSFFKLSPTARGGGAGLEAFTQQVANARALGATKLKCTAARGADFNGYYTWARFGYDGVLSDDERARWGCGTLHELMRTERGRAQWREHGRTFSATFDLADGSTHRSRLDEYRREVAARPPKK